MGGVGFRCVLGGWGRVCVCVDIKTHERTGTAPLIEIIISRHQGYMNTKVKSFLQRWLLFMPAIIEYGIATASKRM